MVDTDINKLNDTDDVVDSGSIEAVRMPAQTPPEAFPLREKPKSVESEKALEAFPSPRPPMPKTRSESLEEELSVGMGEDDPVSKSEGRLVDTRGKGDVSKIETLDELTKYGDREENKFIKGVKSAHGPSES